MARQDTKYCAAPYHNIHTNHHKPPSSYALAHVQASLQQLRADAWAEFDAWKARTNQLAQETTCLPNDPE